jgi:hypothetical protein
VREFATALVSRSVFQHDVEAAEAAWWGAILRSGGGWEITTDYKKKIYCSPWSVSYINFDCIAVSGTCCKLTGLVREFATALVSRSVC